MRIRWVSLLVLVGCADPISNRVFYEDAAFLAALPSPERFRAPPELRLARVGTSAALEQAVLAAAELEEVAALVAVSGEALRTAAPSSRSETVRSWGPVSTAARVDGASRAWSVRGAVLRPVEGGDLEWTIELDTPEGWVVVGAGRHDPDGTGDASWDLPSHAEAIGLADPPGPVAIAYDGEGVAEYVAPALPLPRAWTLLDDGALAWTGALSVTDDGAAWPGRAEATHRAGEGGRASGVVYAGDDELWWEACWDADGDEVYQGGAPGVRAAGDPAACPTL